LFRIRASCGRSARRPRGAEAPPAAAELIERDAQRSLRLGRLRIDLDRALEVLQAVLAASAREHREPESDVADTEFGSSSSALSNSGCARSGFWRRCT
jgi:hypothetical protein